MRSATIKALPGHSADVDNLHISYADIFISQMRAAGGSPSQSQLTVEDVFWNATILHTTDITQPSQSALSKQNVGLHTGKTSTRQHISVGYFVLPGYSQDTADASQVECVELSLLPGMRSWIKRKKKTQFMKIKTFKCPSSKTRSMWWCVIEYRALDACHKHHVANLEIRRWCHYICALTDTQTPRSHMTILIH